MLICCNAKNTAYESRVWDVHGLGFDPARDNQQPYFGDTPDSDRDVLRRWAHNLQLMRSAGVDPMQRMIDRCRRKGIRPWVSIRMNDVHDAHLARSPLHSRFWLDHRDYWRYPDRFTAWNDRCLNYGLAPVREHALALIREVCERYDVDGLELDWNRFPLHFREGEELDEGARADGVDGRGTPGGAGGRRRGGSTRSGWPRECPPGPTWRKARGWTPWPGPAAG